MAYKVSLTYYKKSGKYYSSGEYESEKKELFEIWQEVRDMKDAHPGLIGLWMDGPIQVDVPDHPNSHPHLVMPAPDTSNLKAMWHLLNESNAATMGMKFYRKEGDKLPYRYLLLVEGETEVQEITEAVRRVENGWNSESAGITLVGLNDIIKKANAGIPVKPVEMPTCPGCGDEMIQMGSCYECLNCGEKSGCS